MRGRRSDGGGTCFFSVLTCSPYLNARREDYQAYFRTDSDPALLVLEIPREGCHRCRRTARRTWRMHNGWVQQEFVATGKQIGRLLTQPRCTLEGQARLVRSIVSRCRPIRARTLRTFRPTNANGKDDGQDEPPSRARLASFSNAGTAVQQVGMSPRRATGSQRVGRESQRDHLSRRFREPPDIRRQVAGSLLKGRRP